MWNQKCCCFKMKVVTWNINGIRASNREIPIKKLLDSFQADVICLQETKVTRDQLDETTAIVDGYHAFFSFSKLKGGYSGVATYCRTSCTPLAVEEGLTGFLTEESNKTTINSYANEKLSLNSQELINLDGEGRAILSEHDIQGWKPLVIVNLYCPRADRENEERWAYKQNFYKLVQARCEELLANGKSVMIVGDLNVSHTKLDHCDPDSDPEYFESNESRIWMSNFLLPLSKDSEPCNDGKEENLFCTHEKDSNPSTSYQLAGRGESMTQKSLITNSQNSSKFVDLFRYFHPKRENAFTCWSTVTSARKTNYGTRIDYVIIDKELLVNYAVSCDIRPDIHGSDHCPVEANFSCVVKASSIIPGLCSVFMPEFKGKQKSIKSFLKTGFQKSHSQIVSVSQKTDKRLDNNCNESSKDGKETSGSTKRKAESTMNLKPPAKLQRQDCKEQKVGTRAGSNLMSYFERNSSTTNTKKNTLKNDVLMKFLKDAQVEDEALQNEILRDCDVSCEEHEAGCSSDTLTDSQESSNMGNDSVIAELVIKDKHQDIVAYATGPETAKTQELPSVKNEQNKFQWKSILKGPDPPPLCDGHREECVLRTVKKQGANVGRKFYCCARPEGRANDKEARCKTFIWKKK